ncbi:gluconate 2-dehydrogenase subunit 3 family protein [uncultured Sphingomonas sp.]|uniref:gluconate 2-dehydrogenase subunit 3 family protein n=1 Tax=uncultured Sphingomonas sp. TaxID=158754 RepID=UPI0025EE3CB4|nr:gluconate 2-dehydrogenase subunit 3 family protein [uncultured Sphingomonas sp.]
MTITRRTTLQWFATATTLSIAPWTPAFGAVATGAGTPPPFAVADWPATVAPLPPTRGYGRDPDLADPKVPWPLTFTKAQRAAIDMLGDMILPADAASPGAGKLGVGAFVDEWISAPYPRQQDDRTTIVAGLAWLDAQSQSLHQASFIALTAAQRAMLLDALTAASPAAAMVKPVAFMDRLRNLFVLGFYSLPEGKADMGYIGDQPIEGAYPGPTEAALAHLATVMRELKLEASTRA